MVEEIHQAWNENKVVLSVLGLVLAGLLSWGIWVTHGIYTSQFDSTTLNTVCSDLVLMKEIDKGLKIAAEVQSVKLDIQVLKMETNQIEILKNQAEIIKALNRVVK